MRYKILGAILTAVFLFATLSPGADAHAAESGGSAEAYAAFSAARKATHAAGPFRIRGDETSVVVDTVDGKTSSKTKMFTISGYDFKAAETYMQFALQAKDAGGKRTNSFLITTGKIYAKDNAGEWTEQDILALLPKFLSLGTFDQFIMLELLNSDRLSMYSEFMTLEPPRTMNGTEYNAVSVRISREQFSSLVELLTGDVETLLGPAAEGMSESQLAMVKTFAKGMLLALDAEMTFTAYIDPETGVISRFNTQMNMANPYGLPEPGGVSRIKTSSRLTFYDFGEEITKIVID